MFPALRIAYMVVPRTLLQPLHALLAKNYPSGRVVEQMCLAAFIRDGYFSLHVRRMRRLYQQRRDCLLHLIQQHLGDLLEVHGESAGMHLSVCFRDQSIDDVECSERLAQLGIIAPALSSHRVGQRRHAWSGLMLGYAQVEERAMPGLLARMKQAIK